MNYKPFFLFALFALFILSIFFFPRSSSDLTVVGYVDLSQGLGRQSAELIEAFQQDFKVNFIPTKQPKHSPFWKRKEQWGKVVIFEDLLWAPKRDKYLAITKANPQSIRIAYTMWESTRLPAEWVHILNTHFDAAVVPAPFLVDTYLESGVKIPVFHLPLALNLSPFLSAPLKTNCSTPFVFGNLSVCSERKNHLGLIYAFHQAFGNDPNVQLRLNCRLGEKKVSARITKAIAELELDNVVLTQWKLSSEDYLKTFQSIDCYVSPSKGEGFSIQPREAMALGIPVIATRSTGQIPLCESGLIKVVQATRKEVATYPWGSSYGHYFSCEIEELASAMQEVYDNYSCYLTNNAQFRAWAEQYQFNHLKADYRTLIQPEKVVLGECNRINNGILETNSKELYEKYLNLRLLPLRETKFSGV